MKKFNKRTFIISTSLFGVLLIPCFLAAWGEDEGTLGTNMGGVTFAKLFYVLRFPTHTLLWTIFSDSGAAIFFLGLLLNCCFYGLLTERLFYILKKNKTQSLHVDTKS
jgi:hypothetical protein